MPLRPPWTLSGGEVVLTYSGATIPHHAKFPVKFSGEPAPGDEPTFETRDGGTVTFIAAVNDLVDTALKLQYENTVSFGSAEVYAVDPDTGVRTFIYAENANELGSNVGTTVPFVESVFVFKTVGGHPAKIYLMEAVYDADARNVGTVPADARQDILDYVLSADNWVCGHDATFPLVFKSFTSKVNDVLRKRGGFTDV